MIETALGAELTEHLGYPPGQAPPGGAGNHRNGSHGQDAADRARAGRGQARRAIATATFEPQLVGKRQTRLAGLDEKILGLYAGGMTVRDIEAHLPSSTASRSAATRSAASPTPCSRTSQAWRTRPLDAVYPIVYFDRLMVKVREDRSVRNRACYLAVGVTVEGERDVLGIWWQETEGAKFWLAVLNDLHRRGVADVLIACVDGLHGLPEAIEAVFPQAWVQTCIVHQIRSTHALRRLPRPQEGRRATSSPIYRAVNADAAEHALAALRRALGRALPDDRRVLARRTGSTITPFLALPEDLRRAVYTTNSIENLNRQIRKTIKTRGHIFGWDSVGEFAADVALTIITFGASKWLRTAAKADKARRRAARIKELRKLLMARRAERAKKKLSRAAAALHLLRGDARSAFAEQLKWLKSNWSKVGRKILTDLTASKAQGKDLDIASTAGRRAAKEYVERERDGALRRRGRQVRAARAADPGWAVKPLPEAEDGALRRRSAPTSCSPSGRRQLLNAIRAARLPEPEAN